MSATEAQKRASKKWNDAHMKEKYDRVQLVLAKGKRDSLKAVAERRGLTVGSYIKQLIKQDSGLDL